MATNPRPIVERWSKTQNAKDTRTNTGNWAGTTPKRYPGRGRGIGREVREVVHATGQALGKPRKSENEPSVTIKEECASV